MPSERIQRRVDQLLDEADEAVGRRDWAAVRDAANAVIALDHQNQDALTYLEAARHAGEPEGGAESASQVMTDAASDLPASREMGADRAANPTSFANDRYVVKKFLGEGGKKKVCLAHDTLLDRDVAFALIKIEGLDDIGRDRVAREAKAMGRLGAHPHIVSVYDLGEESGQPYMVTELMGGGDVEGLIEKAPEHRPPLERTLEIGVEVCRGLEFAHSHGIVHRDLKPGNVWLTEGGTAKLGDFGLAVALDKSRLTQAGMMVGTVSYMPPEQAMGGEVTPRSDLYSLGAMLYEMVTGRPPFIGDESVAIITQHLNAMPVAPTWHDESIPAPLEGLILRLLEKDPDKRPTSASDVREALEHLRGLATAKSAGDSVAASSALGISENPMYRRTFVGREAELRQLQQAFDAAASGRGSLAVVVGEPGIGKTSLTEQLATYATIRGGKTLVGHCYEEGSLSIPYLPFVEAMRSYVLTRDSDALRTDLGAGATEVARIVSEIRERLHVEPAEANIADADEERYRLFQSITVFLRNASTVQPLVIVLEDLHDADRGSLDLLVHLARNLSGIRLLLIGTYRDVEVDRSHPLSGALAELRRGSSAARVQLRGLSADEVQRMMSQLSGQDVPWRLAEAVHRQTEGNPLFIQEVLRYLVEEGLIKREEGRWRRASEETPLELGIPEGLRDVIGKRLSRLSDRANQVLAVAAVMGREFRLDVLQRVAGLDEEALYEALAEAKAVAVVEERAALGATVTYRFTHAFFRQTLYEETIAPRRIRLHQQVARALEAVYGRRLDEHAAELAEHYAYSSDPADLAKAVAYGELAAQRAMSVYAYGEAERHLEQALKVQDVLDPDDTVKHCDLLLALGETMLPGEDPGRAVSWAASEAFAIAETIHRPERAAKAATLALEGLLLQNVGSLGSSQFSEWTDRADKYAAVGTRERVYADVCLFLHTLETGGRPNLAHPYLRRAIDGASTAADDATFYLAAGWGVRNLLALCDRDRRLTLAQELRHRPRNGVRSSDLAACLLTLGDASLELGDREAAGELWRELAELASRTRNSGVRVMAKEPDIAMAFLDGQLEKALLLHEERRLLEQEVGSSPLQTSGLVAIRALRYLYQDERALNMAPWGWASTRGRLVATMVTLAALGRREEALPILRQFGNIGADDDETASIFLIHLLETAVLVEDVETAGELARRLTPLASTAWGLATMVAVGRLLGDASVLLSDYDQARNYYGQALAACQQIRNRPELAMTNLELAELLLEHFPNERASAIAHLDFAVGEFGEMKMQPSLERALRHKEVLKA
jgi:tetratricopeptide (TPR) repeat protein